MNANELADLYDSPYEFPEWGSKAQAMLRQQQAEIEALKADKVLHDEAYLSQMKEIEILKEAVELGLYALDNHNGNYKLTKKECDEMGVITEKMMEVLK